MSSKKCIIPIFVPHYGCPHMCVFCDQKTISGQKNIVDENTVIKSIDEALSVLPDNSIKQVAFYGGSFTAIPIEYQIRLLASVQPFIKESLVSSIRLSTRPDAINKDILLMLKEYNVDTIELGTQSLDDEVLKCTGRGHSASCVYDAASLIKSFGFNLILQMMTGLPKDNDTKCIETAKKIIELKPDGVRIYPTVIIKDTSLYDMWKNGEYKEHTVEDAVRVCSDIVPLFESAGIPIIRLGLNPSEDLSLGEAVAGAYHPALGELVYSNIMLKKAERLISENNQNKSIILGVNKSDVSKMIGQHRKNIDYLKNKYNLQSLKVVETLCDNNEIVLMSVEKIM